jgi:hypothetical protein
MLVAVTCIFSTTLESTSGCDKLCTYSGSLCEVIPVSVVPVYGLDTQGAKASTILAADTYIFLTTLKIITAVTNFVFALVCQVT